ncbi:MAG TPA: hypothetical protein VEK08_12535 [Planctomycetota bacterium]|nr:hypothetical protein [Planctomycetota bacterium]
MHFVLGELPQWISDLHGIRYAIELFWQRVPRLAIGEQMALGALLFACLVGAIAAVNRILSGQFAWPVERKKVKTPKKKQGFGVKHLVLLLIALLPGGFVASVTVYAIMGKENWRRDSIAVLGLSIIPALLLLAARSKNFPWPDLHDAIYFSGLLGLIFGLLQLWVLIKLLRQWWGEPDECVPWWPPLALLLQWAMLSGAAYGILNN